MSLIQKLRKEFFDVSPDGTLIYTDPSIGPLLNPHHRLSVRLNDGKSCLELILNGQVQESFHLNGSVSKACREAFGAYFKAFEDICTRKDSESAVA
jgi:hypothetical protein